MLLFRLTRRTKAVLGEKSKRTLWFPRGGYAYVGSALGGGGLTERLLRHLNLKKPKTDRWNIDKLTMSTSFRPLGTITFADPDGVECRLTPLLKRHADVDVAAPGFGSGDDRKRVADGLIDRPCETHTWRVRGPIHPGALAAAMRGEWRPVSWWRRLAASRPAAGRHGL